MKKEIVLGVLFSCIFIAFVSAATPSFFVTLDNPYNLTFGCKNEGKALSICSTSASCNITINYPNSTLLVDNQRATNLNNGKFVYVLNAQQTAVKGEHLVWVGCSDNNLNNSLSFSYEVNPLGSELTSGSSLVYIALLVGVLVIFSISLFLSITLPFRNNRDELGNITGISASKYFKVGLMA